MVGATAVTRDTAQGGEITGMQHEFQFSAASEYVETVEERRAAENSDKSASKAQSQETQKAAPHEITTMVNYIRATNIETQGDKDALSAFYAAIAKIFGRQPEDA